MQYQAKKIGKSSIEWDNSMRKAKLKHIEQLFNNYTKDPQKKLRKEEQECVICFYSQRVGGAACSFRPCGICDKELSSGNTDVSVLCLECAAKAQLCKQCGCDIDFKNRRKREI